MRCVLVLALVTACGGNEGVAVMELAKAAGLERLAIGTTGSPATP